MNDRTMSFGKLTYLGVGFAFLVLLVILSMSLWGLHWTVEGFEAIIHTERLSDQLMQVFSDLKEAEDDQRLFLLTGNTKYLQAFQAVTERIDQEIQGVKVFVKPGTALHEKVLPLQDMVRKRLTLLQDVLDAHDTQGMDKALSLVRTG